MSEHKGNTDKTNQVKLTSVIEQVVWSVGAACTGAKAGVEVYTQFIGNNSEISIEISDKSGKKFDTIKKKMFGNKFWSEIIVPEKAKDELYAEVKLSKHGLEKKSNGLHLFPPIQIKNLKWDKLEAHRGDVLKMTADIEGLADGNEVELQIWEHDSDGVHDFITKFPVLIRNKKIEADWEFQYLEDTDDIPTHEESEKGYQWPEYFFRVVAAGKSADSGLLKFKDWLEFELKDEDGNLLANEKYVLTLADGSKKDGQLNLSGYAKEENIPPGPYIIEFVEVDEHESTNEESQEKTQTQEDDSISEELIKIVLKDHNSIPYSNKKYEIKYNSNTISGQTSRDGVIENQIPAEVMEAELLVWLDDDENVSHRIILHFEQLEPEDNPKGIQKRLQNLGYYAGKIDGELGAMTKEAIYKFQKLHSLPLTGEINSEFVEKVNNKFLNK